MSLWSFCIFGKENHMEYINDFENDLRENGVRQKRPSKAIQVMLEDSWDF